MTPREAQKLQESLYVVGGALEVLLEEIHTYQGPDCALIEDLKEALAGKFPTEILKDFGNRCECYFGGPEITEGEK